MLQPATSACFVWRALSVSSAAWSSSGLLLREIDAGGVEASLTGRPLSLPTTLSLAVDLPMLPVDSRPGEFVPMIELSNAPRIVLLVLLKGLARTLLLLLLALELGLLPLLPAELLVGDTLNMKALAAVVVMLDNYIEAIALFVVSFGNLESVLGAMSAKVRVSQNVPISGSCP